MSEEKTKIYLGDVLISGEDINIDATPTASSTNAVSSGGVYAELADVVRQEDMERLTTTEITNLLNM